MSGEAGDYTACGLRLIVRGDPSPGTYQVAVYCDLPHDHVPCDTHHACIEWDDDTSRRVAQGSHAHLGEGRP
jgi:hypothetical protein